MGLHNDPSFEKRGTMQVVELPSGPFKTPARPVRVDGKPPLICQGTAKVLNSWLGIEAAVGGRAENRGRAVASPGSHPPHHRAAVSRSCTGFVSRHAHESERRLRPA